MQHIKFVCILFVFLCLIFTCTAFGGGSVLEKDDKTLSPYFFVQSDDPEIDQLPLKSTSADVNIAGVIADVQVTQVYKNEGSRALEAVYIFPASTKAAVYGMKMSIGERTITAKINEREKARKDYEQAKHEGKSASLLEQHRPNVFQMNVANIMPGDIIKVEMNYTEMLVPDDGIYEFVYPTVVGPRYSNLKQENAAPSEKWVQNPYLHEKKAPSYDFNIKTKISAGMAVDKIVCPSHKTTINFDSPSIASINLDPVEKQGGNRDFILKYQLRGGKIQTGLLLYEGKDENFFMVMMQPPKRILPEHIPPREYIFIVDVSGSMRGFPLDVSKTLLKNLIKNLRRSDRFNVLLFAGSSQFLSPDLLEATKENIDKAVYFIDNQRGGGGTELLPALKRALKISGNESGSRSIVIVTDGYVRVEKQAFDLIRNELGKSNMFAFGIGTSVNRYLIEGMARAGMGEPFIITKPAQASEKAQKFREYIQSPVLTKVNAVFNDFQAYDVEPPAIPDVLAQRPVIIFGKWKGKLQGNIELKGITGGRQYVKTLDVSSFTSSSVNSGLSYLWARHKIAMLSDYNHVAPNSRLEKEITQLGLDYNLLTQYTSFVAIDNQIRNQNGRVSTVKQPLPLPQGVSDSAVGAKVGQVRVKRGFFANAPSLPARESELTVSSVLKKEKTQIKIQVSSNFDKMIVNGSFSKQYLQKAIQAHFEKIEKCLSSKPEFIKAFPVSNAELKLSIDSDGSVISADFIIQNIKKNPFEFCIIKQAENWQFIMPKDGKPVFVTYNLIIKLES